MKSDNPVFTPAIPRASGDLFPQVPISSVTPTSKVDVCAAGTAGVFFMSCILSVPLLSIIFSYTFRWDANFACGSQDKPTICNCEENFPEFMMILGVDSLVFGALLFCMGGCVGISSRGESENCAKPFIVALTACVSIIFVVVQLVLAIVMFIYMFESDPGCGKELFAWGIFLFVIFCIAVVGQCGGARQKWCAQHNIVFIYIASGCELCVRLSG